MLTIGDARLTMLNGGNFRLDGGAMHGVVPKTLWSKLVSCDALNRCEYATRCLLVEAAGKRVLVETGNGDKFSPKLKDIYGIDHDRAIGDALREVGLAPDDIDFVVMTPPALRPQRRDDAPLDDRQRRWRRCSSGRATSCSAREWEDATHPHERNRASYLQENIAPLRRAGAAPARRRRDGDRARRARHPDARPHRRPPVGADRRGDPGAPKALFLGDVVPTAVHVKLPWVMAYDLDPARTLETKRALFTRAVAGGLAAGLGPRQGPRRRPPGRRQGRRPSWSASWCRRCSRAGRARHVPASLPRARRAWRTLDGDGRGADDHPEVRARTSGSRRFIFIRAVRGVVRRHAAPVPHPRAPRRSEDVAGGWRAVRHRRLHAGRVFQPRHVQRSRSRGAWARHRAIERRLRADACRIPGGCFGLMGLLPADRRSAASSAIFEKRRALIHPD